jgi:hypothetical protein
MSVRDREGATRPLAKDLVAAIAPEELDQFDRTADTFFADPRSVLPSNGRGEPLGSGVETAVGIAAILLYIADKVVDYLVAVSIDRARMTGRRILPRVIRVIVRPRRVTSPDDVPPFTADQREALTDIIVSSGERWGLQRQRSQEIAAIVIDNLRKA